VRHIWSGFDHLAFLIILLLPAFIKQGTARAIDWFKLLGIISAFTFAHSVTLALTVFDLVNPSERAIEIAIAASVIVAALTNLAPGVGAVGIPMAFAFGLLHGFGFASGLQGLHPSAGSLAVALAGFNLGVEVGQLLVVATTFPLIVWLRTRDYYARWVVPACSLLVAGLGFAWMLERVTA
jgi:HupE / UreJ protein